ncbi:MAG: hypothetical protein ACR2OD_10385 [Gaiellaceae bacterium]
MARILVRDVDLFFRAKLEAQLGAAHELVSSGDADLAFVDIGRVELAGAIAELTGTPTIAFTNHTNTDGLRAAHEAGFERVVIRSIIAEQAGKLVDELLGTPNAPN